MSTYAFTCGDVNGIGPEIVLNTLNKLKTSSKRRIIFICPANIFENTSKIVSPKFDYHIGKSIHEQYPANKILILDIGKSNQSYGKISLSSGRTSYNSIINACELAGKGLVDGIITAPISKHAFAKANISFPGHTELLANYFKVSNYSMMFISNKMKAGLVTIHIPIKLIPKKITRKKILSVFIVIQDSLQKDFNIEKPKIAVLGLNPHAGENGNIGNEEELLIKPIIKEFGNNVFGPFVPDAYYGNKEYEKYDCTIGMYMTKF